MLSAASSSPCLMACIREIFSFVAHTSVSIRHHLMMRHLAARVYTHTGSVCCSLVFRRVALSAGLPSTHYSSIGRASPHYALGRRRSGHDGMCQCWRFLVLPRSRAIGLTEHGCADSRQLCTTHPSPMRGGGHATLSGRGATAPCARASPASLWCS